MSKEYWQERARNEYTYKGERFYTITAIPYYVERRKIVINYLKKVSENAKKIVDIGCGDGEYLYLLHEDSKQYCGVDISEEMLKEAGKRCKPFTNVCFECSGDGTHTFFNYDMAYIVAVLAHIDDASMKQIIKNTYEQMSKGGVYVSASRLHHMSRVEKVGREERYLPILMYWNLRDSCVNGVIS